MVAARIRRARGGGRMNNLEDVAIDSGMHHSEDKHCPECGCPWYGNKNLCGDGYRTCYLCGQEWWEDVTYKHSAIRKELGEE